MVSGRRVKPEKADRIKSGEVEAKRRSALRVSRCRPFVGIQSGIRLRRSHFVAARWLARPFAG